MNPVARTQVAAPEDRRVGWCPGALRPMRAGDGLLVRVKPRRARLTLPQARAVAALAVRHGNGAMTLTGKGNLQLRGIGDDALPALTLALEALGLLDGSAQGEAARNVLSNPLAGADPAALADLRPSVAALEERLSAADTVPGLPAKFTWSVDEGGLMPLAGCGADVRFTAVREAGLLELEVALSGGMATGRCRPDDLVRVAARLAAAFLTLCRSQGLTPHRMRDLVARVGAGAVLASAGLAVQQDVATPSRPIGTVGLYRHGRLSFVGVAPPFGLLDAAALDGFAVAAAAAGAPDLRLTPWRSLLAPALPEAAATALWLAFGASGLIREAADPRLLIAACVGAPRCLRATTAVQEDAARLAPFLRAGRTPPQVHVSGCAKGCAHGGTAPVTMVGREGRYDLVRQGRAGDVPVRRGVSPAALRSMVPPDEETLR